jgi:two-component system chemotaxis sensor kinase CheA
MNMQDKEAEYREIFLAEALGNAEEINRLLTALEKEPQEKNTIHALFRIMHTLKGNAAGMGYKGVAELSHVLEDLFGELREGRLVLNENLFASIFKAVDILSHLIDAVRDNADVKYKGIKTKLEIQIKSAKDETKQTITNSAESIQVQSIQDNATRTDFLQSEEVDDVRSDADSKISFSDLVQVPVRKLDNLLNLVGELIIEKDRILASQTGQGLRGSNEYARLSRISSDLQYSVMDVRLVQVGFLFNKFHRVVRDAAYLEKKNVSLKLEGSDTEIDRNVLQVVSDSLIHIIRNCVAHGIELPEDRVKSGKPKDGLITLSASNETDAVLIEISDDGKGLNYEKIKSKAIAQNLISPEDAKDLTKEDLSMLIFQPGFSTADEVTAISGRGVGMDVVKKTLDSIGGTIRVISMEGSGTVIQLTLPSSMALKSSLLFQVHQEVYAIPLAYTESVISFYKSDIHKVGGGLVATHLGKSMAVVFLKDIFEHHAEKTGYRANVLHHSFDNIHPEQKLSIIVVSFNNRTVGFAVDKLLQQKEIVEKPLMRPVDRIQFISGVTILGSGNVCLVLNVPQILQFIFMQSATGKPTKTPP